ncbi:MAG: 4-hydroxy-3-methylbut-2-enyl diphosphate reductase [Candidatus Delongbacteria bacterium]|jgi:4-hydroxy-3-methylbut-2-enyl diphosphate reductase|nr:4-hydroxy-3-methylbut-2-enyl diphosphate reductase [Candidatus Delongbacteria bacterium]
MKIKVIIDNKSGVCGGVSRATRMIEDKMNSIGTDNIYVNGELLHNRLEMERLMDCGLKVEEDVQNIKNGIIFVRTHGVAKKTFEIASLNENKVIDATCPKVSKSQNIIENHFEKGYQIIIVGKEGHPEVQGLLGYCNYEGICVMKENDLEKLDLSKKSLLIAQTTVATSIFQYFIDVISPKIQDLEIAMTICPFVEKREKELIDFAQEFSIIIFIGGKNSSNTKVMFEKLNQYNSRSYLIENKDEINYSWFKENDIVGLSGSASTPIWQIKEIKSVIVDYFKNHDEV